MMLTDIIVFRKKKRAGKPLIHLKSMNTVIIKWMTLIVVAMVYCSSGAWALPASFSNTKADTVDQRLADLLTKTRIEQEFDDKIREQLSTILESNRFVVNSSVDISLSYMNDENIRREGSQRSEDFRNQEMPGTPSLPGFLLLKGLSSTTISGGKSSSGSSMFIDIKQIKVDLLIDEEYTIEEQEFIHKLIQTTVKMKSERGDEVRINQISFPKKEEQIISISDSLNKFLVEVGESEKAAFPFLKNNSIWAAVSGLLLAGFTFISYLLYRNKETGDVIGRSASALVREQNYQPEKISNDTVYVADRPGTEKANEPIKAFTDLLKQDPSDMARFVEYEYQQNSDRIVQVLQTVDKKLIVAMKPYLTEQTYKKLTSELLSSEEICYNLEGVEYFLDEIKKRDNRNALVYKFLPNQTFNFIHLLQVDQMVQLVQALKPVAAAVLLGHLDLQQFNEITERLSDDQAAGIWQYLPMVHSINLEGYEDLSGKVFKKSIKLLGKEKLPDIQLSGLVKALEQTGRNKKELIMNNFRNQGADFSDIILDHVMSIEDLFTMDTEVIAEILSDFDPKEVAVICYLIEDEQVEMILEMRGDREKLLIDGFLKEEIKAKDIRNLQSKLLNRMKQSPYFINSHES